MVDTLDINISFNNGTKDSTLRINPINGWSCSVNILFNEEWIVTGKYTANSLYDLKIKRFTQIETKE